MLVVLLSTLGNAVLKTVNYVLNSYLVDEDDDKQEEDCGSTTTEVRSDPTNEYESDMDFVDLVWLEETENGDDDDGTPNKCCLEVVWTRYVCVFFLCGDNGSALGDVQDWDEHSANE